MQRSQMILVGVSAFSTVAGVTAGYVYGTRKVSAEYEAILTAEIESAKTFYDDFYAKSHKGGIFATPEGAAEALGADEVVLPEQAAEALATYQGMSVNTVTEEKGVVTVAKEVQDEVQDEVQEQNDDNPTREPAVVDDILLDGHPVNLDEFDPEKEVRDPNIPYVISREEYDENPNDNEQAMLTYFAGDDTLVDEDEHQIDDVKENIGEDALKRFGHGSYDSSIVYVRNERRGVDYEVTRSNDTYIHAVFGVDPDETDETIIRHSGRRLRSYDE